MNRALFPVAVVLGTSSLMLVDSAIKGAALLLLATVVTLVFRLDSAATRHLIWLVAIVGMLAVPVFSAILPQWRVLPAWAVISFEAACQKLGVRQPVRLLIHSERTISLVWGIIRLRLLLPAGAR